MKPPKYFYFRVISDKNGITLEDASDVDVSEVVRCKDCKNRFNIDVCKCRGDDWFCGYGERKAK